MSTASGLDSGLQEKTSGFLTSAMLGNHHTGFDLAGERPRLSCMKSQLCVYSGRALVEASNF